ncbi:uncharacterized protein M6B38_340710 [Iris pallida]|uniref:TOG domain-containing protein n=1 Tax=Iris pallida TaxID=29817 RepID=A0AAX6GWG1_IRIPA|nr:uncharacterized protein M6B38_340710 [Iris pallida]
MSGNTLRDLNVLSVSGLEKKSDSSSKGSLTKGDIENTNEKVEKCQNKAVSFPSASPKEHDLGGNGVEVGNSEVEYIESENLTDLPSVDTSLNTLLARLDSKDWVSVCEALNNVRQISLYHKERLNDMLGDVIPLIVKSLKNPRSAVCKTAIMTSADIFKVYSDSIIDLLDPMLVQLLLKSSQDKRFVCEAAVTALIVMTSWVSPALLLPKLQPYLKHKNPRIRAKASMCLSRSVPRLGIEGIKAHGIDKLIQIAACQLSDQLPESREAARSLAMELQTIFETSQASSANGDLPSDTNSWEAFCQAKLSPLSAQAVLRVTSTPKEGLVLGC